MLADTEADVARSAITHFEILGRLDVVLSRSVEIGTATDQKRKRFSQRLNHIASRRARAAMFHIGCEWRYLRHKISRGQSCGG